MYSRLQRETEWLGEGLKEKWRGRERERERGGEGEREKAWAKTARNEETQPTPIDLRWTQRERGREKEFFSC
jgi:hypothetical protein